jgi:tripartite-type tricarboxylate transporter receptor subunit TctC
VTAGFTRRGLGALAGLAPLAAAAQPAGAGPVTLLVGVGPGSGADTWARGFAPFLERHWPHAAVTVANRPGERGLAAARALATAAPDGRLIGAIGTPLLLARAVEAGAERIAACWADARQVAQIVFKPDWTRHAKAAPFKRNDQLLDTLPIGVVVFPGSGVTDNLADKARHLGIPLLDFRGGGA